MPRKIVKNKLSGKHHVIMSILLPNGNLVIPAIIRRSKPPFVGYVEVAPGNPLHKRWWPVREEGPDPRMNPAYHQHVKNIAPDLYDQIMTLTCEMKIERKDKLEREHGRDPA